MKAIPKHHLRGTSVVAGCLVGVAIGVVDVLQKGDLILIPLFVLAPLVASVRATPKQTFRVGVLAAIAAVVFGSVDDIWGTRRHWVAIATTLLGGLLAVWSAASRDARDRELAASVPVLRAADRLKISLATGRMGEWSWDSVSGKVTLDANVAALFGVDFEQFDGTFANWLQLIDERDRSMVQNSVNVAVEHREQFRFDHRTNWTDGSTHWIESIGDVSIDPKSGEVIGAFGLAIDIDERHRQVEERTRLLELESSQRRRAEYMANLNAGISLSVNIDEILKTATKSAISELADWCSIVLSIDRPHARPSIAVAHRDPAKVAWARQLQQDYPYDPEARWGAAEVIRTGKREMIRKVESRAVAATAGDILQQADLGSVLTIPLVGALGTLGALQWIRGVKIDPFSDAEIEFIEEISGRVAGVLNNAVLYQRQARSRSALATLQTVSGLIASVSTKDEVSRATLVEGGRGLGATSGTLFVVDSEGDLIVGEEVGLADQVRRDAELRLAQQAVASGELVTGTVTTDDGERFVVATPMQVLNRMIGSLAFTFDDQREPTPEEQSMLVTLGFRCAGALERASLYERERTIALTLQHRLLSTIRTTPDWMQVAASYVPATGLEIGGDWFQLLNVSADRVVAIVGDAVGHGLTSAAAMGQLRASFATAVSNNHDPLIALAAVDKFAELGADTVGASAAYLLVDQAGFATYANAGHPPIVVVPSVGSARIVDEAEGGLLGYRTTEVNSVQIPFESGDLIVMFTDGLVESRTESIDDGISRLVASAEASRHLPLQDLCETVVEQLTRDRSVEDDIAIVILRRE